MKILRNTSQQWIFAPACFTFTSLCRNSPHYQSAPKTSILKGLGEPSGLNTVKQFLILHLHVFIPHSSTFALFALSSEALFVRAERLRHPLIFYLGHTATFYINKLIVGNFITQNQRINPQLESVFAVGVDEMSWDDILDDDKYEWSKVWYLSADSDCRIQSNV